MGASSSQSQREVVAPRTSANTKPFYVLASFITIIGLHLIGTLYPGYATWGFNYWSLFSLPVALGLLVLALMLLIPTVSVLVTNFLSSVLAPIDSFLRSWNRMVLISSLSLLLFGLLYIFRSRAHVYGDGFMVLATQTDIEKPFELNVYFMKPLVVLFHRFAFHMLSFIIPAAPENIFAIINAVGGVLGVWALYRISRLLSSHRASRWFIFFAALISGAVVLFFSYLENYTWPLALALWSLAFSIGFVTKKNPRWPALLTAILAVGFHVVTLPFLIVAILASIGYFDKRLNLARKVPFALLAWGSVVATIVLALVIQVSKLSKFIVTLWPQLHRPYWSLSAGHIIDIFNESILVAPIGAIVLLTLLFVHRKNDRIQSPVSKVLALASLLTFLFSFWIEPKLGAPRDWDLLSFFGFPLSLWGAYQLANFSSRLRPSRTWVAGVIVVAAIHVVPNIVEKNDLKRATHHLDRMLWDSPQYQADYDKARRALVWGTILRDAVDEPELAVKHFRRRLSADSTCATSWFGIGDWFAKQQKYDSAAFYWRQMAHHDQSYTGYLIKLAAVEAELQNFDTAQQIMAQCLKLAPDDYKVHYAAGLIASAAGNTNEALSRFREALRLQPDADKAVLNIGLIYSHVKQYDSAYVYLKQAQKTIPDNTDLYRALLTTEVALGKLDEARQTFEQYRKLNPNAPIDSLWPENWRQ
jgi:tetratricopeptide (TPR) repeat protein